MLESTLVRAEMVRIRTSFSTARLAGLWTSPYPQRQYSTVLGCEIREQTDDPDIAITVRPSRPMSVHAIGYAVSLPGAVWQRR